MGHVSDRRCGDSAEGDGKMMLDELPQEILEHILKLACLSPPTLCRKGADGDDAAGDEDEDEAHGNDSGQRQAALDPTYMLESTVFRVRKQYEDAVHADLKTCRAVALVSRRWSAVGIDCLYRSVQLTDAWSLQRFARGLRDRPERGRAVRHLFVGHVSVGPAIPARATADAPGEHVHRCFGLTDEDTTEDFREEIAEVCRTCGVDGTGVCPQICGLNAGREWIGDDDWMHRIYEVKERCVDNHPAYRFRTPKKDADHFLHPLLYARSRAVYLLTGERLPSYSFPTFDDLPTQDEDDEYRPHSIGENIDLTDSARMVRDMRALSVQPGVEPKLPTIQALLRDVVAILRRCPNIEAVAVNGAFERSLTSPTIPFPKTLGTLRSLSLGPPPIFWSSQLNFGGSDHPVFANIEDLAIYGCLFFPEEAKALGGEGGALPKLKRLRWCFTVQPTDQPSYEVASFQDTVELLLGNRSEEQDEAVREEQEFRAQLSQADQDGEAIARVLHNPPPAPVRRGVQRLCCTFSRTVVLDLQQHARPELLADPRLSIEVAESDDQVEDCYRSIARWRGVVAGEPLDRAGRGADRNLFVR